MSSLFQQCPYQTRSTISTFILHAVHRNLWHGVQGAWHSYAVSTSVRVCGLTPVSAREMSDVFTTAVLRADLKQHHRGAMSCVVDAGVPTNQRQAMPASHGGLQVSWHRQDVLRYSARGTCLPVMFVLTLIPQSQHARGNSSAIAFSMADHQNNQPEIAPQAPTLLHVVHIMTTHHT